MKDSIGFIIPSTTLPTISDADMAHIRPPYVHFKRQSEEYILYVIRSGELYLTEYMAANDSFMIDWGLLGRFYIDSGKYSYVDFIKSTPQYIYPGSNTLSAKLYGTTGSLSITLRRFDYVRGV